VVDTGPAIVTHRTLTRTGNVSHPPEACILNIAARNPVCSRHGCGTRSRMRRERGVKWSRRAARLSEAELPAVRPLESDPRVRDRDIAREDQPARPPRERYPAPDGYVPLQTESCARAPSHNLSTDAVTETDSVITGLTGHKIQRDHREPGPGRWRGRSRLTQP